jgi:hypothetical protein
MEDIARRTGARIEIVEPGRATLKDNIGVYNPKDHTIYVRKTLPDEEITRAIGHELGHHFEKVAGRVNITPKMQKELEGVYSTLATGREAAAGATRRLPDYFGYKPKEAPRELIVEGIRAYMEDPNYFKTVAPEAAKAIREAFNANRQLSHTIQFNTAGSPAGAAAASVQAPTTPPWLLLGPNEL